MENFGAFILGRNMFGPVRGEWPDGSWKGWWGDNAPFHSPTFVLTHYEREPLVMEGGTTSSLLPGASKKPCDAQNKQRVIRTSKSEAVFRRSGSICRPG